MADNKPSKPFPPRWAMIYMLVLILAATPECLVSAVGLDERLDGLVQVSERGRAPLGFAAVAVVQVQPDIQPDLDAVGKGLAVDSQADPREAAEVDRRDRLLAVNVLRHAVRGDDEQRVGICRRAAQEAPHPVPGLRED